jgi:hypothetical protein
MNLQTQHIIDELRRKIFQAESNIISAKKTLEKLEREASRPDYTQIDGIVGVFDGFKMTAEDGTEYEVPSNYAAKTKLVFGDTLKLIEENGKKLFKQIERVERTKVEGILTKKEGEWYILTDRGSYKVSDTAAEFQGAALNSQATAYIPTNKPDAPFAAIDHVEGFGMNTKPEKPEEREEKAPKAKEPAKSTKKVEKPEETQEKEEKKPAKKASTTKPRAKTAKPADKKPCKPRAKKDDEVKEVKVPKKVDIEDDDLV